MIRGTAGRLQNAPTTTFAQVKERDKLRLMT
jgi:hypothetical protein